MTRAKQIKILMIQRDISAADIARQAKVDPSAISHVLAGRRRSVVLRKAIAAALGLSVEDLWPTEGAVSASVSP